MKNQTVFPLVHMGGTPITRLINDYKEAQRTLARAMLHFQLIEFNARDYHQRGGKAYEEAIAERLRVAECLKSAETYLSNHVEYLVDVNDMIEVA